MIRLMGSTFLALIIAVTVSAADKVKPVEKTLDEKRGSIDTALFEMIRMMEAKEYKTLIETFATPDNLKKMTENKKIEDIAAKFGEEKAERMLKILKELKDAKPVMSEKDTKATYALKEEVAGKKEISFVKIDKFWYIDGK